MISGLLTSVIASSAKNVTPLATGVLHIDFIRRYVVTTPPATIFLVRRYVVTTPPATIFLVRRYVVTI